MKTSEKGIDLIKSFEGLKLESYLCPAGVWTIGYGHTKGVSKGQVISKTQAEYLLGKDLIEYENAVSRHNLQLSQNQFDALVSFTFNLGVGNLTKSTLLKKTKINPNDPSIRAEFLRWNNVNKKPSVGLTRRRKAEADLYFK